MFTMKAIGDKCTLIGDNGKYLSRCKCCWKGAASPNSVFLNESSPVGRARWKIEKRGNKYTFQAETGKYMASCKGCVKGGTYPSFAFVHIKNPAEPWANWDIEVV